MFNFFGNSKELQYVVQSIKYYTYCVNKFGYKPTTVEKFIDKYLDRKCNNDYSLFIRATYNGKYIPIVDIDNGQTEDKLSLACLWLSENNIKYVVISSGPTNYWIVLDYLTRSWKKAYKLASLVPHNDLEYVNCGYLNKDFVIRATTKHPKRRKINDESNPIIHEDNLDKVSLELREFILKLKANYYDNPNIQWINRYYRYINNNIDLSDPKTGESFISVPVGLQAD